jgi:DNA modification methylase
MPGFDLPPLNMQEHFLSANEDAYARAKANGRLFPDVKPSATKMHKTKRESLADRVGESVRIVAEIPATDSVLIWCDTNYESEALVAAFKEYSKSINDSDPEKSIACWPTEVTGSDKTEEKERKLMSFTDGGCNLLISKPQIAGFGLNWQHCHHMIFVGVSYSFEATYQALRRSYRFGQEHTVNAHIIYAETEGNIISTLHRKQEDFKIMQDNMNEAMNEHGLFRDDNKRILKAAEFEHTTEGDWTMYLGDCVPVTEGLPDDSIDFCIHSPPFANLYIYSDSDADMGNAADDEEFFKHYRYLIKELYRVTAPGRLCAVHCKDLPAYINRDGYAGLVDFPGAIIQAFQDEGWKFHSRVTIWKDPVIEMQRTKNHGLLHKNFTKEANAVRQGMADYMVVFRKWPIAEQTQVKQNRVVGDYIGEKPPTETEIVGWGKRTEQSNYSIAVWQRYASPVWFDIDQTRVLNYRMAKGNQDEKHICPLQLDVIARSIDLWSNPGDTVLSPFAGIGSEGYEALRMNRKFIGIELKRSYYDYAIKHLQEIAQTKNQPTLFDLMGEE